MYNIQTRVYLTNLAKYNEGVLVGEWVDLSEGHNVVTKCLKRVLGNDEEYFISDYEADFDISEYENLEELTEFAGYFDKLSDYEKTSVIYLLDYLCLERSEVLEKMRNDDVLGDLCLYEASNEEELGREISEYMEIPENLKFYINYEMIGRDEVANGATQVGDYYVIG